MSHAIDSISQKVGGYSILMDGGYSGGDCQVSFSVWREGICLHATQRIFRTTSEMSSEWDAYARGVKNGTIGLPGGIPVHDCGEHPVEYESDGPLGHGFECGVCGCFLQAG